MADQNISYRVTTKGTEKAAANFKRLGLAVVGAFGGLIAITGLIRLTKHLKDTARDAEETRQRFAIVFSSIGQGAENVADTFAKSFRIAGTTSRELLGNTGDLLVGFGFTERAALNMSLQINTLAQDLASFTNFAGGAVGASLALTKALIGETESAKALFISIQQTTKEFIKNVKAIQEAQGVTLLQAKSIEILRIITVQAEKSIGDFGRTEQSLANQERILSEQLKETSETLGKELVPAFLLWNQTMLLTVKSLFGIGRAIDEIFSGDRGNFFEFALPTKDAILTADQLQNISNIIGGMIDKGKKVIIGPGLQTQLDDFKAINESVSRILGEVEEIKINITATKLALDEWKGSSEGYKKLLLELKTEEDKLKLPIEVLNSELEEMNKHLMAGVGILKQEAVLFEAIGAGITGFLPAGKGIEGRQGKADATPIFGTGAQRAKVFKDAKVVGNTIFEGWANVLTSNMNTAWAEIFGEANSLFEQLINSMVDLLVKDLFAGLLSFLPGGSILSGVFGLFGGGSPISGGGGTALGSQTIVLEIGGRRMGEFVLEGNRQIQQLRLT